jgi:hypothetical protein
MDKRAQERSLLNRFREHANLTGKLLESVNPRFEAVMNDLRATDEKIREYARQSRDLIKYSKSLVSRRDYLAAATNMAMFHERARYIAAELARFIGSVDKEGYKVLLDQFDDEQKKRIFKYQPKGELNLEKPSFADDMEIFASFEKEAGLADWWASLTDDRAKAMKALEKRFSVGFLKSMRDDSINMYNESQRFLAQLFATLKKLATAVATRKPSMYVQLAKDFVKKFERYHESFAAYYDKTVGPLKEAQEKMMEEAKQEEQKRYEQAQGYFEGGGTPKSPEEMKQQISMAPGEPAQAPTQKEKEETLEKLKEERENKQIPFDLVQKKKEQARVANFIAQIERVASSGDSKTLVRKILAFSEECEESNPELSLKMISIVEGLIEDTKC